MALLIADEKCLLLHHKNFSRVLNKRSRLSSKTSGAICSWSSPIQSGIPSNLPRLYED